MRGEEKYKKRYLDRFSIDASQFQEDLCTIRREKKESEERERGDQCACSLCQKFFGTMTITN